ncbi:uncharacterized protein MONBRDRAFT_36969 [Monosiga brevicollis MX1]|uniref:Transmembrane protein 242 n=1 Tax=Monosiga brevicollis TaxID=81824 RepID=A9UYQ7_MONBE|nr:uncharacterized protein MONBRDRAFT_36969 [Monosiga brevicollis MX1]EDQ89648.1 predicted protein [Monosiga brevicollis MX1]|eukprot:XP_001745677.1 hypothetical protein [Monosiga brevicollis MX1]
MGDVSVRETAILHKAGVPEAYDAWMQYVWKDGGLNKTMVAMALGSLALGSFAFGFIRNFRRMRQQNVEVHDEQAVKAALAQAEAEGRDLRAEGVTLASRALVIATSMVVSVGLAIPAGLHFIGGFQTVGEFNTRARQIFDGIRMPRETTEEEHREFQSLVDMMYESLPLKASSHDVDAETSPESSPAASTAT